VTILGDRVTGLGDRDANFGVERRGCGSTYRQSYKTFVSSITGCGAK